VDIEYGKKVAWMLCEWKINVLCNKVSSGEFDQNCKIFKDAIRAVQKTGKRPTFKIMTNRRKVMRNWKQRESQEVIEILAKRGEIIINEEKHPTSYWLPKAQEEA
jgi:hypothetical protein